MSNSGHFCESQGQYPTGNCSSILDCATCSLTPGCVFCNGTNSCVTSMETECAAQVMQSFHTFISTSDLIEIEVFSRFVLLINA